MNRLVWLQRDLRLADHEPLRQALKAPGKLVMAYFHDPKRTIGDANSVWLTHSLKSLQTAVRAKGGELLMLEGDFSVNFTRLITHYSIDEVLYHYEVGEPFKQQQDAALTLCQQHQIALKPYDQAWQPAEHIRSQKGGTYSVFTPYYKKLLTLMNHIERPLDEVTDFSAHQPKQPALAEWLVIPQSLETLAQTAWAKSMMSYWQVGEQAAWREFEAFCDNGLNDYPVLRDFPAQPATSRLSVRLHFGEVSSRQLLDHLQSLKSQPSTEIHAIDNFVRQLAWREFGRYLLHLHPQLETQAFQTKFEQFPWDDNPQHLLDWQRGLTGIPIIDAGMRELWHTGWMHNRVRMLVASWLTKNANLSWREGQAWFANTLIDADPANNAMGWQWVAGCGVDAAPYYRLFNPILQSEKFDAQAAYIKHWLPELKSVPAKFVHAPWQHEQKLNELGFDLNQDYVKPRIDLSLSRQDHLDRVQSQKSYTQALQLQN